MSVTVRITNKFTTIDPVGWMQVIYSDPEVDGDSGDYPSCMSMDDGLPDDSFDVTAVCFEGEAVFHLFVYDTSPPFAGLYQSTDLGCTFLSTTVSPGENIAYYRFLVGCSGEEGPCGMDESNTGRC